LTFARAVACCVALCLAAAPARAQEPSLIISGPAHRVMTDGFDTTSVERVFCVHWHDVADDSVALDSAFLPKIDSADKWHVWYKNCPRGLGNRALAPLGPRRARSPQRPGLGDARRLRRCLRRARYASPSRRSHARLSVLRPMKPYVRRSSVSRTVAQSVERRVAIAEIAGSSPAACSRVTWDERLFWLMIGFVYGLGLAWMLA
jgi:hypothetical protein